MQRKHIFGLQIKNNLLENHADTEEWFSSCHYFFFVVATSKVITGDFSSATDYSTGP